MTERGILIESVQEELRLVDREDRVGLLPIVLCVPLQFYPYSHDCADRYLMKWNLELTTLQSVQRVGVAGLTS